MAEEARAALETLRGLAEAAGLPEGLAEEVGRLAASDRVEPEAVGRLLDRAVEGDANAEAGEALRRALLSHALPTARAAAAAGGDPGPALMALARLGAWLAERDGAGEAAELLGAGAEVAEGAPPSDPFVLILLRDLQASALCDAGRLEEAAAPARAAERRARELCAPGDPRLAMVLNNVGSVHKRRGDFLTAEVCFRRALSVVEAAGPGARPLAAAACLNLSDVLSAQGRAEAAREHAERGVRETERLHGAFHPETADAVSHLALLLEEVGRPDEAARQHRRAGAILARGLGEEHPLAAGARERAARLERGVRGGEVEGTEQGG